MKVEDINKVQWSNQPTPVEIIGTTFGNELQTKILTTSRISNFLLFYLCFLATYRYLMVGN